MVWIGRMLRSERLRRTLVSALVLVVCTGLGSLYLSILNHSYRLSDWLAFPLLQVVLWAALLHLGLVMAGARLLRWLIPVEELPAGESFLQSFGVGAGLFALSMYIGGALGLFRPWFAVLLPLAFMALGLPELPRLTRLLRDALRPVASASVPGSLLRLGAFAFGAVMLALVYLEALSPSSFNFDAIWYHVPVAQDYARNGGLVPYYGDNHRAYPHLTSLFHTWALLVPALDPVQFKWMLMLHLEFAVVLWRIVGVAAMVRWLLNGRKVPGVWPVFFLFPSLFVYDQNIGGSADHVIGVTAIPIFLALMRALPRFHGGYALLTGILAGVHILTKYQAIYSVVAVALFAALRAAYLLLVRAFRSYRGRSSPLEFPRVRASVLGPLLIVLGALLVASPHFIKNTVYYQNPVYPFAQKRFPSSFDDWQDERPHAGEKAARKAKRGKSQSRAGEDDAPLTSREGRKKDPWDFEFVHRGIDFLPQGDGPIERIYWWHKTLLDWPFFTGNRGFTDKRPYMGALFVLLLPTLLLLRGARRLWLATAYTYVTFSVWALTSANDRYLLTILGLPIAITGALIVRAAALGLLARLGVAALVSVQLLWGIDAPLQYGGARLQETVSLIREGYSGKAIEERMDHRREELTVSASLPKDAVVLGRYYKSLLGFDRTTLNTHADIQTYIDFKNLESLDEFWRICRDRGVTHLLYPDGQRQPVRAQELVLFDALVEASPVKTRTHGLVIAELDDEAPGSPEQFLVLVIGVREYANGLYRVQDLTLDNRRPPKKTPSPVAAFDADATDRLLTRAHAVLLGGRKRNLLGEGLDETFKRVEDFRSLEVWLRKAEE